MRYTPPVGGQPNDPYTDGDQATGTEGSPVPARAIEAPQREIVDVITEAGMVPEDGNFTQLRQAIQKMIIAGQKAVVLDGAIFDASVTSGEAVRWDSGVGKFDEALADGTVNNRAVGIADVANGKVYLYGECPLFAGLTPGARYYLDAATPGALTVTPPADGVMVGVAKSATTLFVDIDALGVRSDQRNIWSKAQAGTEAPLPATTGTVTLDLATANNHGGTLTGAIVLATPSNIQPGQSGVIRLQQPAAATATIAYGSVWKPADGTSLPALTALAGATDDLVYYVETATRIVVGRVGGAA